MPTPISGERHILVAIETVRQCLVSDQIDLARQTAESLLAVLPDHAPSLQLLALAEARAKRYSRAAELLKRALLVEPQQWLWRVDLGTVYSAAHEWKCAASQFAEALKCDCNHVRALSGHARALLELGEFEAARVSFKLLTQLQTGARAPVLGLARACIGESKYDEAATVLQQALQADANSTEYLVMLAKIYSRCGEKELARKCWESVVNLSPGDVEASEALVRVCSELSDLSATLRHCRALIDSGSATEELYSFFVFANLYEPQHTPESIKDTCKSFGAFLYKGEPTRFEAQPSEREGKRLRIGYLSGEFSRQAGFHFLSPWLGNHDQSQFEVICYNTLPAFDDQTKWYPAVTEWRNCAGWDDDRIIQQIRSDGIEILSDVSGLFPGHRLGVFARRAAPIQVTYPQCPLTTGIESMDYVLTDAWTCPPGMEGQYTERAVRLQSGYVAYTPLAAAPPVSQLPAATNRAVTFGLFQRRPKMNTAVWDTIAEILHLCPSSRLLIQNANATLDESGSFARRELLREFSLRGIDMGRLQILGARTQLETIESMSRADIALDTFPYQGQTTTCECLWMGVPVIALSGRTHVSRVGSAILQRLGLGDLAAETQQEYVHTAVRLANDVERLSVLRRTLRDRVRKSSLLDGKKLVRQVEAAYRWMWTNWCTGSRKPFLNDLTGG